MLECVIHSGNTNAVLFILTMSCYKNNCFSQAACCIEMKNFFNKMFNKADFSLCLMSREKFQKLYLSRWAGDVGQMSFINNQARKYFLSLFSALQASCGFSSCLQSRQDALKTLVSSLEICWVCFKRHYISLKLSDIFKRSLSVCSNFWKTNIWTCRFLKYFSYLKNFLKQTFYEGLTRLIIYISTHQFRCINDAVIVVQSLTKNQKLEKVFHFWKLFDHSQCTITIHLYLFIFRLNFI